MEPIYITHPYEPPSYVYRIFAEDGLLLYIGSTLDLPTRLQRHSYGAKWFPLAHRVELEEFESREAALVAEREAVRRENPAGNAKWTKRHRGGAPAVRDPRLAERGIPDAAR